MINVTTDRRPSHVNYESFESVPGKERCKILHSIKLCTHVSSPFSLKWSEDHKLAVILDKGINIYELHADPRHGDTLALNLLFASIPAPSVERVKELTDKLELEKCFFKDTNDRLSVYDLLMENQLLAGVVQKKTIQVGFKYLLWSPLGIGEDKSCFLATLGVDNIVSLYTFKERVAIEICQVTKLWQEHFSSDSKSSDNELKLEEIKPKLMALFTNAICWSHAFTSESNMYAFLIMGQRNSDIIIWKVEPYKEDSPFVTIAGHFHTDNDDIITCLAWKKNGNNAGYLLVGYLSGRIKVFSISEDPETGSVYCSNVITLLCEGDSMSVTSFHVITKGDFMILLCTKENFVFAWKVYLKHNSVVDHCYTKIPALSITGLQPFTDEHIFAVNMLDGRMKKVIIHDIAFTKLWFEHTSIETPTYNGEIVNNYSLSATSNCAIWCFTSEDCRYYKSNTDQRWTTLYFFTFYSIPDVVECLLSDEHADLEKKFDLLELIRLMAVAGHKNKMWFNWKTDFDTDKIYSVQILQVFHWLLCIQEASTEYQEIAGLEELVNDITCLVKGRLFKYKALDTLKNIVLQSDKPDILKIGRNLAMYLDKHNYGLSTADRELVDNIISNTQASEVEELCPACDQKFLEESLPDTPKFELLICPNDHKMAVCFRTLNMCLKDYFICHRCIHYAESKSALNVGKCVYCNGTLSSVNELNNTHRAPRHMDARMPELGAYNNNSSDDME